MQVQLRSLQSGEVLPGERWRAVPWRNEAQRVINIEALCQSLASDLEIDELKAGDFAIQMIEGAKKQSFIPANRE